MHDAIPERHTTQTQFGHLWRQHLPDGCPLLLARLETTRVSRLQLLDGTQEGLVGGGHTSAELSTDALGETRGTEATDQLTSVLLTPGGV